MEIKFENFMESLNFLIPVNNIINLEQVEWIEPVGLTVVKAYLEYFKLNNNLVEIIMPKNNNVKKYLEVMNYNEYNKKSTYVPLEIVKDISVDKVSNEISDKILLQENFINLNEDDYKDASKYLKYMISELLNNAIQHSYSKIGAVASAQYFSSQNKIQVSIVDKGIGFLNSLKNKYNLSNELDALNKSLEKEVTGATGIYNSSINNAGYGLFVLKEIIKIYKGQLLMISNNGCLLIDRNGNIYNNILDYKYYGTCVSFELYGNFYGYEFNEFFENFIYPSENQADIF